MIKNLNGAGTVLLSPGIPCRERADAFDAAVKANSGLKATTREISIPGAAESAQAATSAWLSANASAKGLFAIFNCYDDDAMGAIAALKQNGRTDVQVYSFNATAPAVQAVKDGTMTATLGVDVTSAGKETDRSDSRTHQGGRRLAAKVVYPRLHDRHQGQCRSGSEEPPAIGWSEGAPAPSPIGRSG
jgi:ABC-type sugar transport system substrate-binding protein